MNVRAADLENVAQIMPLVFLGVLGFGLGLRLVYLFNFLSPIN